MHIYWYGLSSFKIVTKDVTIFTDPFSKAAGPTPPRGAGNLVIVSDIESGYVNNIQSISGEPFIIADPGEYDVKNIFVRGVPTESESKKEDRTTTSHKTIYTLTVEEMTIGFLGALNQTKLNEQQVEDLNDVDILLVPVGGTNVCDADAAAEIVNQLEPNIVIPMYYKSPGISIKLDSAEKFIKEIGSKGEEMDKLLIKKNELEEEKTRIVILSPQRS